MSIIDLARHFALLQETKEVPIPYMETRKEQLLKKRGEEQDLAVAFRKEAQYIHFPVQNIQVGTNTDVTVLSNFLSKYAGSFFSVLHGIFIQILVDKREASKEEIIGFYSHHILKRRGGYVVDRDTIIEQMRKKITGELVEHAMEPKTFTLPKFFGKQITLLLAKPLPISHIVQKFIFDCGLVGYLPHTSERDRVSFYEVLRAMEMVFNHILEMQYAHKRIAKGEIHVDNNSNEYILTRVCAQGEKPETFRFHQVTQQDIFTQAGIFFETNSEQKQTPEIIPTKNNEITHTRTKMKTFNKEKEHIAHPTPQEPIKKTIYYTHKGPHDTNSPLDIRIIPNPFTHIEDFFTH